MRAAAAFIILTSTIAGCGTPKEPPKRDVVYQTSAIGAVLDGVYDGDATFRDLARRGDFGLGTFNALDGEMLADRGRFYQIRADGTASRVDMDDGDVRTPFAAVTFFEPDRYHVVENAQGYDALLQRLDGLRTSNNLPFAIRVAGRFELIRARSVPRQQRPYKRLPEVVDGQSTFEMGDVTGVMVGFWFPPYMSGLNVPGYHFHFISGDGRRGGHVLEARPRDVRIEIDDSPGLRVRLPRDEAFRAARMNAGDATRDAELRKVEQGR